MAPSPDEPYPPFSDGARRRYNEEVDVFGRLLAEHARGQALDGHATLVSEKHVALAIVKLSRPATSEAPVTKRSADTLGPAAGHRDHAPESRWAPAPLLVAMSGIAGTALLAAAQDWRWANLAIGAFLAVVIVILLIQRWRT